MDKIINYIKEPSRILYALNNKGLIYLDDKTFLKYRYYYTFKKKLNLENPRTFNEKLQWLKLYDRNPEYTKMVDKYEAKKYVANIIGEEYIIPTLGIYDKFEDVNFSKLPNQFVLKCTHDSGGLIICKDKSELDLKDAKKKINKFLRKNYYYEGREWPYKNVKPRIIIEKFMQDENKQELKDYKLMCFNGKVKCIFVCSNRDTEIGLNIDIFDTNWNKMLFGRINHPNSKIPIAKPYNLDKMIMLAEKLSKDISFIRVDFYEINGKIYFGELTFYPAAGFEKFEPEEYDKILGDILELPKTKTGEEQDEK